MKKGKRIDSLNGETPLPEAMIHHIQSFLSGKEAARSTILSKSWYNAWFTRPSLDFDERDFSQQSSRKSGNFGQQSSRKFDEFATKTMQRYIDLSLKIDSFRLCSQGYNRWPLADKLIVDAMKIGATDVQLNLPSSNTLPQEVLGSKTLVRLSISWCGVDWNHFSCSSLKSLSLNFVRVRSDDEFKDIISCCNSLEELSLSQCYDLAINPKNLNELHKLRRLTLYRVVVDCMFFTDFESRFPCLKDLSVQECNGPSNIQIASTSLQTISFKPVSGSWKAKFDVPNIRKFTYSGFSLPHFSINGALREREFDISIAPNTFHKPSWFLNLKKLLTKFRLSRISLSINLGMSERPGRRFNSEHEVDIEVVPNPLVVENLMINAPSSFCCALLIRLFGICRPKFITRYWLSRKCHGGVCGKDESLDILWKRLMQQLINPKCGIPDQSMFGQFGLKRVNAEVYEMFGTEWRPMLLKKPPDPSKGLVSRRKISKGSVSERKIQFELIWED